MAKLLAKITTKNVIGDMKDIAAHMRVAGEHSKLLYNVLGIARAAEAKETDYGIGTKFKGNFMAVNLLTGEEFRAGSCYLVGAANELLAGAIGDSPVEFGFVIGVELDDASATGYVYTAESLIKPTENDPLTLLSKSISAAAPAQLALTEAEPKAVVKGSKK